MSHPRREPSILPRRLTPIVAFARLTAGAVLAEAVR